MRGVYRAFGNFQSIMHDHTDPACSSCCNIPACVRVDHSAGGGEKLERRQKTMNHEDKVQVVQEMIGGLCKPEFLQALEEAGYYEAPAGVYHHGAYVGGLFDHSMNVAERLNMLTVCLGLKWERPESPAVIGILHDVCKLWQYDTEYVEKTEQVDGREAIVEVPQFSWRKHQDMPGHGDASLIRIMQLGGMELTREEIYCIRYHMAAYEGKEAWDALDKAIRQYPNIIYTHTADMLASKVDEKEG